MYDALSKLVERAGVGDVGLLSGTGGAGMAIVTDIWRAAQGQIGIDRGDGKPRLPRADGGRGLVPRLARPAPLERRSPSTRPVTPPTIPSGGSARRRHGPRRCGVSCWPPFQRRSGPAQGSCSGWPRGGSRCARRQAIVPPGDRRGGGPRALGEHLAADGVLEDPEDVFYLTKEELRGEPRPMQSSWSRSAVSAAPTTRRTPSRTVGGGSRMSRRNRTRAIARVT